MTGPLTLAECGKRDFEVVTPGVRYRYQSAVGLTFTFDRVRWKSDELHCELTVECDLAAAGAVNDHTVSIATFNVSSDRTRAERAKRIQAVTSLREVPVDRLLEDACQRVLAAERTGQPSVDLRAIERRAEGAQDLDHYGVVIPLRHPSILFGDGGSLKSYLALYLAAALAFQGLRVGFFDWELEAEDHKDRLARMFGHEEPEIRYARCDRPLTQEIDRLRRIVEVDRLDFAVFDSVAFACDGPPEAAEVASRYFQALRQLRVGSLHLAHVTKADTGDQRPFGSAFWHNGARATWFIKPNDPLPNSPRVSLGIYPRKRNLGALPPPVGLAFDFAPEEVTVSRIAIDSVPDLDAKLPIRLRMLRLLRGGALSPEAIADELSADAETVRRTLRRYKGEFTLLPGGKYAILERRTA